MTKIIDNLKAELFFRQKIQIQLFVWFSGDLSIYKLFCNLLKQKIIQNVIRQTWDDCIWRSTCDFSAQPRLWKLGPPRLEIPFK